MVLRSERRASLQTGPPGSAFAFSAADVGRALRQERNRQGLSLRDVSMRTGVPQDQLRAAETGVFGGPDALAALKTVRRYADLLGLPGDRFALTILEQWPTRARNGDLAPAEAAAASGGEAGADGRSTGVLAAVGARSSEGNGNGHTPRSGVATAPGPAAGDDPPTTSLTTVSLWSAWRPSSIDSPYIGDALSDTGVTPAVPGADVFRPRRRVPVLIKALVAAVVLCVIAGVAVIAIDRLRPVWLHEIGLLRGSAPPAQAPNRPAADHHAAVATTALRLRKASAGEGVVKVGSPYTAEVSTVGGPCWVQVSKAGTSSPVFAGVIEPGAPKSFPSTGTLTVELGSTSGRFSLTSKSGRVSSYQPRSAPFRIVVEEH